MSIVEPPVLDPQAGKTKSNYNVLVTETHLNNDLNTSDKDNRHEHLLCV